MQEQDTHRHQGAGYLPHTTMVRGPKVISTSTYYADMPNAVSRSLYLSMDPTNEELRPSPANMRLHQMGPYAEQPTYYRPSQDRSLVMETQ